MAKLQNPGPARRQITLDNMQRLVGHSSRDNVAERVKMLDGYHTPKIAVLELLRREKFQRQIWEPANGFHKISRVLEKRGHRIYTSDIYRWHRKTQRQRAFQEFRQLPFRRGDIITNPPFRLAQAFVETGLRLLRRRGKLALLLRIQFLEGIKRKQQLYDKNPPARILVFSYRLPRMHRFKYNGNKGGSMVAFAWFIWIKGHRQPTEIHWT